VAFDKKRGGNTMRTRKIGQIMAMSSLSVFLLSGCFKTTGGGWFLDDEGDVVNFGFNAQPVGEPTGNCDGYPFPFPDVPTCWEAKGTLTLIDHGNVSGERLKLKGSFTGTFNPESGDPSDGSQFNGTATLNGQEYDMGFRVSDYGEGRLDDGDFFFLMLEPKGGGELIVYIGNLGGGNIQVHAKSR